MGIDFGQAQPSLAVEVSPLRQVISAASAFNKGYTVPTSSDPNFTAPAGALDQSSLQQLSDYFRTIGEPPTAHPASFSLNALTDGHGIRFVKGVAASGTNPRVWAAAGKGVWDSTVGAWVHTMQTDPLRGLLEAAGMASGIAAVVGIEILTGGAATPFLIAGLGALGAVETLPTLAQSFSDEFMNPTDENLVKLLVSTGNAYLAIGSPIKGIRGMKAARGLLGQQIGRIGTPWRDQGVVNAVVSGNEKWRSLIGDGSPVDKQLVELPIGAEKLAQTLQQMGVQDASEARKLLQSTQGYEALVQAFQRLGPADLESRDKIAAEMQNVLKGELAPARIKFAINYGFRPEITSEGQGLAQILDDAATVDDVKTLLDQGQAVPSKWAKRFPELEGTYPGQFKVAPLDLMHEAESERALPLEFHQTMDKHFGQAAGIIRDDARRIVDRPDVIFERGARGVMSGGIATGHAELSNAIDAMMEHAGVSYDDWVKIRDVLEDESLAEDLSGEQLAFARRIGWLGNFRTASEVRSGHTDLPLGGRFPRYVVHEPGVDPAQSPVHTLQQAMLQRNVSMNRIWKAMADVKTGEAQIQQKYQTAKEFEAEQAAKKQAFEAARPTREFYLRGENKTLVTGLRRSHGGFKRGITLRKNAARTANQALQAARQGTDQAAIAAAEKTAKAADGAVKAGEGRLAQHLKDVAGQHGQVAAELVAMSSRELEKMVSANPGALQLLHPYDALKLDAWRFLMAQHQEMLRSMVMTAAHMVPQTMTKEMGWLEKNLGVEFRRAQLKEDDLPPAVEETIFRQRGDAEREAQQVGYLKVIPAMGEAGTLNYHPAIYARESIAHPFLQEMDKAVGVDEFTNSALRAFYNVGVAIPKRLAFVSPAWHAFNVAGRSLAGFLQDPALGGAATLRTITLKLHDPEQYAALQKRAREDGLVPAHKFNASNEVHHHEQERTGQVTWPGGIRIPGPVRAVSDWYNDLFEQGFWKMVSDVGLIAYQVGAERIKARNPGISEAQAGEFGAQYGNVVSGMVNKQYMSKLWSYASNLAFFAPRYWSTFKDAALSSVMPARLSHLLARLDNAGGPINPVRLRAIDYTVRRELLRAQRGWFLTYMATAMTATDLFNVMFSGKHVWQNPKGREWDVCFDKAFGVQPTAGGAMDHACISALPGLRQGVDVLNALGLGHSYGLAHLLTDEQYQKADAVHKVGLELDAAIDGLRRVGAGKISMAANVLPAFLTGEDTYSWLATGSKVNVPRLESLLQLTPVGWQTQRAVQEMTQAGMDPKQAALQVGQAELQQLTGLPTLYWTGTQRKPIDDDAFKKWQQNRSGFQQAALSDSQQLMSGRLSPYQWWLDREQRLSAQLQSDADTFGQDSPAGALAATRQRLWQQNGLSDEAMPREERFQRLDLFNSQWQAALESANPETRALWWDHERVQWTDADYLYWLSGQVKDALMGMIDGVNGAHIRAAQAQLGVFYNLPGLDPSVGAALRAKDPYLYTYHAILKELGKMSPLGALASAFTSPYSNTTILPSGLTQEQLAVVEAMLSPSSTAIRGETAQSLAASAETLAASPEGEAAGGQLGTTAAFRGQLLPAVRQALTQYVQEHPGDPNAGAIEQVLAGAKS